jgi:peptide/nickel transport system ATP-binding protein
MVEHFLSIQHLSIEYSTIRGQVKAVTDVSLHLDKGSTLGVVGESGCGKSTLGFAILNLLPASGKVVGGKIILDQTNILEKSEEELRRIRGGEISMIFQDPMTSLNPLMRIRDHFSELLKIHRPSITRQDSIAESSKLLDTLGIARERLNDYPHQFSGGMRQRVMIGLALALNPKLVIADEPTTALDVIVEAQILELLKKLKSEYGLTLVLITHNIGIVAEMADTIAVMYAGKIAELGTTKEIFADPLHPYTKGLLESTPNIVHPERSMRPIPGSPPDLINLPHGCKFHPRCPRVFEPCRTLEPVPLEHRGRLVACHLYQKAASQ